MSDEMSKASSLRSRLPTNYEADMQVAGALATHQLPSIFTNAMADVPMGPGRRELNRAAILGQAHSPFLHLRWARPPRELNRAAILGEAHSPFRWAKPLQAAIDELDLYGYNILWCHGAAGGARRY